MVDRIILHVTRHTPSCCIKHTGVIRTACSTGYSRSRATQGTHTGIKIYYWLLVLTDKCSTLCFDSHSVRPIEELYIKNRESDILFGIAQGSDRNVQTVRCGLLLVWFSFPFTMPKAVSQICDDFTLL